MRKVRIAHIGCNKNSHAKQIFRSLMVQPDLFEIVGYTLPENERESAGNRASVFEGYREMTLEEILNDPTIEAVTVETEELRLTKYAQMAAEHGKHIHMEKPGGIDPAAFEKLIKTVKRSGKTLHLGYMYRYNPVVMELFERIKAGELGEIISVEAQMNCHHPAELREWLGLHPGGMMFYLGCHLIDLILQIQGKPDAILPMNRATGVEGVGAEDFGMAVFQYPHGISFAKTVAMEYGGYLRRSLVVTGSLATVELKPFEYGTQQEMYTDVRTYCEHSWSDQGTAKTVGPYDRYDAMMAAFAAMVRGERENPHTPDYELELYRTLMTCCGVKL